MEPAPWYDERDESGRVPGPRDGRHSDDARFAEDPRFAEESHFAEEPRYESTPRRGGSGRGGSDRGGSDRGGSDRGGSDRGGSGRGGSGRGGGPARGRRSGLELPPDLDPDAGREAPIWEPGGADGPGWAPGAPDAGGWAEGGWEAGHGSPGWEAGREGAEGQAWVAGADSLERIDRSQMRGRPAAEPAPAPGGGTTYAAGHGPTQTIGRPPAVYRSRRVGIAALLALAVTAADLLILFKVLFDSVAAHPTRAAGILGGLFALAGIPMVAMGLYGLATGAATAGGPNVGRAWLRTPLAYLPVGLILIIAAGLAL